MAVIDHLVYAVADLDEAVALFESMTGIRPALGGAHVGRGTHNALVSFGTGYVELIAVDPNQPVPSTPRPFGIDDLGGPALITCAVRPDDGMTIDEVVAGARSAGHDPGPITAMSRRTTSGDLLSWRLTAPPTSIDGVDLGGLVPFVIDWADTAMPNLTAPGGVALTSLSMTHPRADVVAAAHAALGGVPVTVETVSAVTFTACLSGPAGSITLER